jgi:hypothetical protein
VIKIDLREIGWEGVEWVHLAEDGLVVGFCEHCDEPSDSDTTELVSLGR